MTAARGFMRIGGIALACLAIVGCSAPPRQAGETAAPRQSVQEAAWEAIAHGAPVIDVRTEAEFQEGHLPDALNIPHDQIRSRVAELPADKSQTLVLYCRSGRRSGLAQQDLEQLGYANTINAGGYEDMMRARPR